MKKNVAVVMGGYSSEYDISMKSVQVVFDNLEGELYNCFKIVIRKDKWICLDESDKEFDIFKDDFSVHLKTKSKL